MALIIEKPIAIYNPTAIKPGYLVYAKHRTWNKGEAGFVTSVTDRKITVQYHPGIGNVTNHFYIPIDELMDNQWELRWSEDLQEIQRYEEASSHES